MEKYNKEFGSQESEYRIPSPTQKKEKINIVSAINNSLIFRLIKLCGLSKKSYIC